MTYIHTFALSSLEFQRKQRRNKKEERKLFHETDKDAIPKDKGCSGLEGAHNMLFSVTNFSVQSIFQFRCCVAKKQCLLLKTQVFQERSLLHVFWHILSEAQRSTFFLEVSHEEFPFQLWVTRVWTLACVFQDTVYKILSNQLLRCLFE